MAWGGGVAEGGGGRESRREGDGGPRMNVRNIEDRKKYNKMKHKLLSRRKKRNRL